MKIFLDTAETEIVSKHFKTGLIDGLTTNPSLIRKSGRKHEEVYQEFKDIGLKDISMEVIGSKTVNQSSLKVFTNDICFSSV